MLLTKTDFKLYLESPVHLWAKFRDLENYKVKISDFDRYLAQQGYAVESLSKKYLEQKLKVDYPKDSKIEFQKTIIDGDYESRIDAVIFDSTTGKCDIFEIKSKTKVEKEDKYDITFQYLIAQKNLDINNVYLIHVNGDYVKNSDLNLFEFFTLVDASEIVNDQAAEVLEKRGDAINILKIKTAPTEEHCYKPAICPCINLCHPNLTEYSIYDLPYGNQSKYKQLLEMNIHSLDQIPSNFDLNERQKAAVQTAYQKKPVVYRDKIKTELESLTFPLYFLDYETFKPAIPAIDGYKPYQDIIFQYSLHVVENEDGEAKHFEFLHAKDTDPSPAITQSLRENITDTGSIIVWHKGFEMERNKELAELQPKLSGFLQNVNERIFDLKEIFSNSLYNDYRFHGSASIKAVLPVLIPELSYKDLDIGEGTAAMTKWHELVFDNKSEEIKQKIENDLLKYCELDTLAMVEVWRFLKKL